MLSLKDGGFGCCPMPSAVCCKDGTHCCPHGTNCNTEKGTCDSVAANLVSALSTSKASAFSFCCVQVINNAGSLGHSLRREGGRDSGSRRDEYSFVLRKLLSVKASERELEGKGSILGTFVKCGIYRQKCLFHCCRRSKGPPV